MFLAYIYICVVAFLLSFFLVFPIRRFSIRLKIVDVADGKKKLHRGAVPLLGGLAVFCSFVAVVLLHILIPNLLIKMGRGDWIPVFLKGCVEGAMAQVHLLLVIIGGGLVFFLVGLLDDIGRVSVGIRFLFEFGAAAALITAGIRLGLGFLPEYLALIASAVWIVGIANAFNLLDGLDGLCSGVTAICALILTFVMVRGNQPLHAFLTLAVTGTAAGFLWHNWFPAKIYLGSSGSLFLGYILAVSVSVASFSIGGASSSFSIFMPLFLLAVPIYDTASVVLIRFRERRPIFKGDRRHIHHRLLGAGFSEKGAVLFIWCLTFTTGISAALLVTAELWESLLLFLQISLAFTLIIIVKHIRLQNHPIQSESQDIEASNSHTRAPDTDSSSP